MQEFIHNNDKLKDKDINTEEAIVKVLLTKDDKVGVVFNNRFYDFVGVKTEESESFDDAIKRIFRDDFEISIPGDSIPSYSYQGKYYIKDYPRRNKNSIINIYYYIIPLEDNTYKSTDDLKFMLIDKSDAINEFKTKKPFMKLDKYENEDMVNILENL